MYFYAICWKKMSSVNKEQVGGGGVIWEGGRGILI